MKKMILLSAVSSLSLGVFAQLTDSLAPKEMEQAVVTGQYRSNSLKNSVYQVRVIGKEQIRLSGAVNTQQVLATQLGFRFAQDNTLGTSDVQLMGMSGRNVKILMDGVPLADRGDTRESLNQVDVNTIERIEIVEGPLSVSYGSDALAGVINIITRKNQKTNWLITAKTQEETVGDEYHPFHYRGLHSQHLGLEFNKNNWQIGAGGTHQEFNGWGGDQFGRNNKWKPKEQWLGHLRTGYTRNRFSIYYRLDGLHEEITDRAAINMDTYKAIDKQYTTKRFLHQVQSDLSFNNDLGWNSVLAYTVLRRKTTTTRHDFEKNTDELTTGAGEQDLSKFRSLIFRNTVNWKLSDIVSLQPGVDMQQERASGARIKGEPSITDLALFVSAEIKPTKGFTIRPGLRVIHNSVYDAPPLVPSLNTRITITKNSVLRLAYAYGFRSPALRELYFEFRDANHQLVGNPDLKAEHSNSFSGSLQQEILDRGESKWVLNAGGFYNEFRDLISFAQSGTDPNLFMTVNIDKFKTTGLTLENKFTKGVFNGTLGFACVGRYNQFSEDPEFETEDPPTFMWSPELNASLAWEIPVIKTSLAAYYKFTGERPGYQTVYNNATAKYDLEETRIGSCHWTDITLTRAFLKYLAVIAGVKNLFNVRDLRNTISGGAHGSGGPVATGYGRSGFLALTFRWTK